MNAPRFGVEDTWRAVAGCPCDECAVAARAAIPRVTLNPAKLADDVEIWLELRPENDLPTPAPRPATPARQPVAPLRSSTATTTDKALEALKRMGWL